MQENNVPSSSNSEQDNALLSDYGYYCNDKVSMEEMPLSFKDWKQMINNVDKELNQGENPELSVATDEKSETPAPTTKTIEQEREANGFPKQCPITGLPFFMAIERGSEILATYGGPYDSYTTPIPNEDEPDEWTMERYDHDEGAWVEDEGIGLDGINQYRKSNGLPPLPPNTPELSGEDLVKVNDVVHLIFSHYSQSGGYTRTATGFIRKLLGREWEYDEELKRLQELASSQQSVPVVQAKVKCTCVGEGYSDPECPKCAPVVQVDVEQLAKREARRLHDIYTKRDKFTNPAYYSGAYDGVIAACQSLSKQSAPQADIEKLEPFIQKWKWQYRSGDPNRIDVSRELRADLQILLSNSKGCNT